MHENIDEVRAAKRRILRAVDGARLVVVGDERRFAVWCGGCTINVYSARTGNVIDTFSFGHQYRDVPQEYAEHCMHQYWETERAGTE